VVQGRYPASVPVPYQEAFLKELTLLFPRDCRRSQRAAAIEMMASGAFDTGGLISETRPPDMAPRTYSALAEADPALLTVEFEW